MNVFRQAIFIRMDVKLSTNKSAVTTLFKRRNMMSEPKTSSYPTIGIRPAIDGRRKGVRESLEDQTMGMANARQTF
jgi:hypothetical protein